MNGLQKGATVDFSKSDIDRFWGKVAVGNPDACWEWQGTLNSDGYGSMQIRGRSGGAYRAAWECTYGPIPGGLSVLHKCDNRKCCNPNHLFLGTQSDNAKDMWSKGRAYTGGHKQPNTWSRGEGNGRAKLTAEQARNIRASYRQQTVSTRSLAQKYGVDASTIRRVLRNKETKGVLSPSQIDEICNEYEQGKGCSAYELASLHGVSKSEIQHIVSGRTWKEGANGNSR